MSDCDPHGERCRSPDCEDWRGLYAHIEQQDESLREELLAERAYADKAWQDHEMATAVSNWRYRAERTERVVVFVREHAAEIEAGWPELTALVDSPEAGKVWAGEEVERLRAELNDVQGQVMSFSAALAEISHMGDLAAGANAKDIARQSLYDTHSPRSER